MRRFVGDASHELRTPLTSVRGYTELYRSGATDDVELVLTRIDDESRRISLLVEGTDHRTVYLTVVNVKGQILFPYAVEIFFISPNDGKTVHFLAEGNVASHGNAGHRIRLTVTV